MGSQKVLLGGNVMTMDESRPWAEALIVQNDRIRFVGTSQEARSQASSDAEFLDLDGQTVIPGFNDNHIHALFGGGNFTIPRLYDKTRDEIVAVLKEWYPDPGPDEVIMGVGWDYRTCPDPHRAFLDRHFPNNPVILRQFSGHGFWANSLALDRMKIDRNTAEHLGAVIVKDSDGNPTGVLRDFWRNRYLQRLEHRDERDPARVDASLSRILREYARHGITSVQDNTWFPSVVSGLGRAKEAGILTCRFSCWFAGETPLLPSMLMRLRRFDPLWYREGLYKYFPDGTFSTRTAWMTEPYADDPASVGMGKGRDQILKFLLPRVRRHQQVGCHAIGDRAVKEFLDAVEIAQKRYRWTRDLRLRLEQCTGHPH